MIKNRKTKSFFILGLSLIMSLGLISCGNKKADFQPISKSDILLDTPCKVTIYDDVPETVLDKAFDVLKEVDSRMNASSEIQEKGMLRYQMILFM